MIEKMKRVSIVLLNKDKEKALKSLRKAGLVHLEKIEGSSEKLNVYKEQSSALLISESILGEIKVPKKKTPVPEMTEEEIVALCNEIVAKSEKKKQLLELPFCDRLWTIYLAVSKSTMAFFNCFD